jgi:serine/threonine-protein kinase
MTFTKSGNFYIYTLLSLVLFFVAANVSSEIILRGELVSLPDLVGQTLEEARAELGAKKITLSIEDYEFDSRYGKGRIIVQTPSKGSRIKPRRAVKVVVSRGSEQVGTPKFEGRSLEWAASALKEAGLRRGHLSRIHTGLYAAGRIIAQDPAAGATVDRSTPVNFLVSQGDWEERYIMPDLIEMRAETALRRLKELGFKVTDVSYAYYPGRESGIILKQFPVQGQQILKRNEITLEVSR